MSSLKRLFPILKIECTDNEYLRGRAILTPKNKHILAINNEILKKLPTEENLQSSVLMKMYQTTDFNMVKKILII